MAEDQRLEDYRDRLMGAFYRGAGIDPPAMTPDRIAGLVERPDSEAMIEWERRHVARARARLRALALLPRTAQERR